MEHKHCTDRTVGVITLHSDPIQQGRKCLKVVQFLMMHFIFVGSQILQVSTRLPHQKHALKSESKVCNLKEPRQSWARNPMWLPCLPVMSKSCTFHCLLPTQLPNYVIKIVIVQPRSLGTYYNMYLESCQLLSKLCFCIQYATNLFKMKLTTCIFAALLYL